MATLQCRSCGGKYVDVLPDGMRYFHHCPPLSAPELAAAVAAGAVALPPGETVQQALRRRTYQRKGQRDENVLRGDDPGQPPRNKAEGKGVVTLPEAADASPLVVVDV